ncbi:hypothetical protein [Ferruginibacter sp. HRS2-29]|uniref:hypothetical protein n=1 Tax=Ferruginibacter sp. HRS2-29 TaxID=2487334 RepID=UPI0020CC7891|nr:hypothetical protein [Ferruginibacter sp. HRS2-29]MCP9751011.1 hypothetical protein [Ferruginibacter sp. HRS2-29]
MIQSLSNRYNKYIAYPLFVIFCLQWLLPLRAAAYGERSYRSYDRTNNEHAKRVAKSIYPFVSNSGPASAPVKAVLDRKATSLRVAANKPFIGGPSAPEASTFKAVGSDNLVNLFTGDFSYSIPLLDVGGYPVNLFYNGGITMEQEASWVGLGWNINPGTVSRNMRGVPDDFDGTDMLVTHQNTKPNRTYGGEVSVDGELLGFKKPKASVSLGFSYNNYLGPELTLGAGISAALVTFDNLKFEKSSTDSLGLSLQASVNAKLSSRSGLTLAPSLNLATKLLGGKIQNGIGLSTSYNSRSGISALNIHGEMSYYSDRNQIKYELINPLSSTSISFAKPSYMPIMRMPMENINLSGQFEAGAGLWGIRGAITLNGYYSQSKVPTEWQTLRKPLVGFMYSEKALANKDAVMDFNRVNDGEVTPNTPVISAPQYAYDVFSIQGEGTGGSIRAYRSDLGYMRDNITVSKDKSLSLGADIAPPGHWGGNFNFISTPTKAGSWDDVSSNTLIRTMAFKAPQKNSLFENVYFKNPGEATVTDPALLSMIGGEDLVRFKLSGSNVNPRLESILELFNKKTGSVKGLKSLSGNTTLVNRQKRTQVTTMLTAADASVYGLDKQIRNYSGNFAGDTIQYSNISRTEDFRKPNHISEIDVLEQNGMRYVYGLPVYNKIQKDFTFSVGAVPNSTSDNLVNFYTNEASVNSPYMANKSEIDGYVQVQETPAYAASFLLTGLLSPDYVDVTGDGITEDDLGGAVKFDYQRSEGYHQWRTPRNNTNGQQAHFNEGVRTQKEDNKATISYGEREGWYLKAIESKSMVAIFKTDSRNDAKGVSSDMNGAINNSEDVNKKLSRIDLYTKAEIKSKGIANARPIKSVIFNYDSSLCMGTPDSKNGGGKLTLRSIYFSYNGQTRLMKDRYVFDYGNLSSATDNPHYAYNASDKWGTYKDPAEATIHPAGLTNMDYPYTDYSDKTKNDQFAGAWALKKILLPSGGQMEIQYEADDYGYVQDRRACNMMNIYGLGNTTAYGNDSAMYRNGGIAEDNNYVYVKLASPLTSTGDARLKQEIYSKYLEGINQLAFKLQIHMPKGLEPLTVYSEIESYGVCSNSASKDYIYIKLKTINGKSPLATSAIGFLTDNIPAQAFDGYKTEVDDLGDFIKLAGTMLGQLKNAFKNVEQQMRSAALAKNIAPGRSFVRLDNPGRMKYGGGHRVKRVLVRDNWKKMTSDSSFTSTYGQDYDYTTTEMVDGVPTTISSGVASYEPGIGSEENPFREIVQFSNKLPLASARYGAIEMPILEGLYPSPVVGYSKVTVRSIHRKGTHGDSTLRSAIGKQVTEFFTAREYPAYATYTPMDSKTYNKNPFFSFLYKEVISRRTITQGFLVETNDMHGKMKSQSAYSESDEKTPLSASYYTYKNTGKNGFNDQVDYVYNDEGGIVRKGNMGIDIELMTDVREFKVQSNGLSAQGQLDVFPLGLLIWTVFTLWPLKTYTENQYRAVTCTKLINYHAIEDSVIVMDKGSVITTKTMAYDAETGQGIITKTANEFNDPVYNTTYPSYWAYSSTGLAYKNINAVLTADFANGKISLSQADQNKYFESGDELYVISRGNTFDPCTAQSANVNKVWVYDTNKDITPLNVVNKSLVFMDAKGNLYNNNSVVFRIIRSGKRNLLGMNVASFTTMANPVQAVGGENKLKVESSSKTIVASAMEHKEKWQADNDVFTKKTLVYSNEICGFVPVDDCINGKYEQAINPYVKGILGNLRLDKSYVFYNERMETIASPTAIRKNGYLKDFYSYWNFDGNNNLVPSNASGKWVWNSTVTKVTNKGQEAETKNALDVYTSAQFGFSKTQTTAVANNSRLNDMFAEGFEDHGYSPVINGSVAGNACTKPHIDFSVAANAQILTDDLPRPTAHSGHKYLRVLPGQTSGMLDSIESVLDIFQMPLVLDTLRSLDEPGSFMERLYSIPSLAGDASPMNTCLSISNFAEDSIIHNGISNTCGEYFSQGYQGYEFIELNSDGFVTIDLQSYAAASIGANIYGATANCYISDLDDNSIGVVASLSSVLPDGITSKVFCLKKGIYKISVNYTATHTHNYECSDVGTPLGGAFIFKTMISGDVSACYKTIHKSDACTYTRPIPATKDMINPVFAPTPGKDMLFSAWVRETCNAPCVQEKYTHSQVQLIFNDGSTTTTSLNPSGPIIEGWQKVEGKFTIPLTATNMEIRFRNSSDSAIYFDDIRIHPYNANLKSYVYDPRTLRLVAELDENNYASFYEYDEEGQMVRVKKETIEGIKTIQETRNAKQQSITGVQ